MVKVRLLILLTTILVVFALGTSVFYYAKGYRLNSKNMKFSSNGLLVIKSYPDSAQVYIDNELKTATNTTISLLPGIYDVSIKKEGYISWNKRLTIEKEVVTEATAHLFKSVPSLSAITFTGVDKLIPSPDTTKIAYIVSVNKDFKGSEGLWIMETANLPLGFSRDPRKIFDGNLSDSQITWSPDSRQILISSTKGKFLIDSSNFTPQAQLTNISANIDSILKTWEKEKQDKLSAKIKKLPEEMQNILSKRTSSLVFSPDEDMVLYTASSSATIADNLIKQLPGSSTQQQERNIKIGSTYIYDIKEDRNFFVTDKNPYLSGWINYSQLLILTPTNNTESLFWFPSSRNIIYSQEDKVIIMDYDGTNKQEVYKGSYVTPFAYPTLSLDRLIILTNLGSNSSPANLYSLSLK